MGVYALTSIGGAPGVTTTAIAWALLSDTPTLIVEADITGGSAILAGPYRAEQPHTTSLLALTVRPDRMTLVDHLWTQTVPLPGSTTAHLLPGIATPTQAGSLTNLWPTLGKALKHISTESGIDVLIDLGRYRSPLPAAPLLQHVDAAAVFTTTTLPELYRARTGLASLRADLREVEGESSKNTRTGLICVTAPHGGYPASDAGKVVTPTPVLATIPHQPRAAATYSVGAERTSTRLRPGPQGAFDNAIRAVTAAVRGQGTTYAQMMKGSAA